MADRLSALYRDLLDGTYDCVDRIVLNAYFRPGHNPGGFRVWWRRLTGSDASLDNAHLMRMAGRFSRRVRAYAKAHGIPVIDCSIGDRKHDLAEQHLTTTRVTKGLFLILVGRAQAPVWDVSGKHHLERKRPMPYVNHYSFHILDPEWGHVTIKISGHPPFPAQVILNGHEWVASHARQAGIHFIKEGNCFTHISVFQALIDRTRTRMDLRTVKTILGYRHRPRYRPRRGKTPTWEVTVERPVYDLTIFKLHCGLLTLKIYTKGERVLRIEATAHNTRALGRRSLDQFPHLLSDLKAILERFVTALACVDQCFIGGETLDQLPMASQVGQTRVAGIDLQKPRLRWVAEAVLALALAPRGFTASDLAEQVHRLGGPAASAYTARRAAYDLKKFRGKQLVRRVDGTRRYEPVATGLKTVAALIVLRHHVLKPLLAAAEQTSPARGPHHPTALDRHYAALRTHMHGVFQELGIAA
jgi:hypothetical protein